MADPIASEGSFNQPVMAEPKMRRDVIWLLVVFIAANCYARTGRIGCKKNDS